MNWICVGKFVSVSIHLRIRSNELFLVLVYLYYVHAYFYCRTNERFSEPDFACVRGAGMVLVWCWYGAGMQGGSLVGSTSPEHEY